MPREKMWVEYEDGTHLSQSQKKPGDYSPLTREDDTSRLGQVTLSPIDEDEADSPTDSPPVFAFVTDEYALDSRAKESSKREELLGALVLLGVIVALEKAKPHVKQWWNDQACPTIKSSWNRLARTREADSQASTAESSTLMESAPEESSQEVVAALEAHRASMSSAEARERFVAALAARLFSEEQLRMLRNSRIEDEDGPLELNSTTEMPAAKQVGDIIRLMLEANPSLPDEETSVELGNILGRARVDDGYVPLRSERNKEALRLTDGEM
jgi:hypothetical protein